MNTTLLTLFRKSVYTGLLLTCLSCNISNPNEKTSAQNSINDTSHLVAGTNADSVRVWGDLKTLNYDNWNTFWKAFLKAAEKKDTSTLVELTYFPFIQNTDSVTQHEFIELWISQTYGFSKKHPSVTGPDNWYPGMQIDSSGTFPTIDSCHYANNSGKDFYFAKVNGYYRLIKVITPG